MEATLNNKVSRERLGETSRILGWWAAIGTVENKTCGNLDRKFYQVKSKPLCVAWHEVMGRNFYHVSAKWVSCRAFAISNLNQ